MTRRKRRKQDVCWTDMRSLDRHVALGCWTLGSSMFFAHFWWSEERRENAFDETEGEGRNTQKLRSPNLQMVELVLRDPNFACAAGNTERAEPHSRAFGRG